MNFAPEPRSLVKVEILPAAEADLLNLLEYGASQWGRDAALRFVLSFHEVYQLLADYPQIGRERPEVNQEIRSWSHRGHIVFYRLYESRVLIARIIHGSADIKPIDVWG